MGAVLIQMKLAVQTKVTPAMQEKLIRCLTQNNILKKYHAVKS